MRIATGSAAVIPFIDWLTGWHAWMEAAVTAWDRGQPLPAVPQIVAAGPAASPEAGSSANTAPPTVATPSVTTQAVAVPAPRRIDLDDPAGCQDVAVLPDDADPELVRLFCEDSQLSLIHI